MPKISCARKPCPRGRICDPVEKVCLSRRDKRAKEVMKIRFKQDLEKVDKIKRDLREARRRARRAQSTKVQAKIEDKAVAQAEKQIVKVVESVRETKASAGWKQWVGTIRQGEPGFKAECRKNLTLNNLTPNTLNLQCAKKRRSYQSVRVSGRDRLSRPPRFPFKTYVSEISCRLG